MNRLFDTNDSVDFGQMKNEPFKWIYRLTLPYLVWLINETDICFTDLSIFYQFGKPLRINKHLLTKVQENRIIDIIKELGVNSGTENSISYLITIEILANLIERKIIRINQFEEYDFRFTERTIISNKKKLENPTSTFNQISLKRDTYLTSLIQL